MCPLIITNLFDPIWAVNIWLRAAPVPEDSALAPQCPPALTVYSLFQFSDSTQADIQHICAIY